MSGSVLSLYSLTLLKDSTASETNLFKSVGSKHMVFAYYYSLLLVPRMFQYPVAIRHDWRMARIRLNEQFLKLITKFKGKHCKSLTWKAFSQKLSLCCFTSHWFTKLLAASKEEGNNRLKR